MRRKILYIFRAIFISFTLYFLYFYSSRRKRSSDEIEFTIDMVHILPGYPKSSTANPSITLLAFYLQLPQGFSNNIVDKDVLKHIKLWVTFLVDNGTDTAFLLWAFLLFAAERLFCFPEQKFVRTDAQQISEREI